MRARMNLLPLPRSMELTDELVPVRPPQLMIDASFPAEGYVLRINADAVELFGADDAGLFYGQATLEQLARVNDGALPAGTIRDHPDLAVRGVMLDVSRDKVPTMDTLRALVDRLASCKINQVQLYIEHTFAYQEHPDVHDAASPFTAEEISDLDEFCRQRHVELVPNQNCLGHMNRWLAHERYRPLAIAPDGFVDPYGITRPAMTIEPAHSGSLDLVRELLAELLPLFSSHRVHVGLDEAWELPADRIEDYLDWVTRLRALPELEGREMLIWGDMVSGRADLLGRLPSGVTVCEWGYDDWYPFDERCATAADSGVPFWVAPGTSSWLSILGRTTNAVSTCRHAAEAALLHRAGGFLNTDWGDQGHLQQSIVSEPAFAYGAAVSWCLASNAELDLASALSTHVFADETGQLARAVLDLGDAHRMITPQFPNMSALTANLYYPQLPVGRGLTQGLAAEELDEVDGCLDRSRQAARQSQPARPDGALLVEEAVFGADLVGLLVGDARERLAADGRIESVSDRARSALAADLDDLIDRYRELWLARNRPGGLPDSLSWLENLRSAYVTGRTDPAWGGLRAPG